MIMKFTIFDYECFLNPYELSFKHWQNLNWSDANCVMSIRGGDPDFYYAEKMPVELAEFYEFIFSRGEHLFWIAPYSELRTINDAFNKVLMSLPKGGEFIAIPKNDEYYEETCFTEPLNSDKFDFSSFKEDKFLKT